jgi:hypothetical protein
VRAGVWRDHLWIEIWLSDDSVIAQQLRDGLIIVEIGVRQLPQNPFLGQLSYIQCISPVQTAVLGHD